MKHPFALSIGVLALVGLPSLPAQDDRGTEAKVDALLRAQMDKAHIPGLSVAVVRAGKVVLAKGYGQSNVELGVAATADTVYQIGSITKPFTATAVMLLVEEGKVSLDDPISKHLSTVPEAWAEVRVRHLLTHTSGIKSYTSLPDNLKQFRQDVSREAVLKSVTDLPLEFKPGEKFAYCNTGYFLLGMLVEKVSGKPYADFLDERIFKPLEMTGTRINDPRAVLKNRAAGYSWEKNALLNGEPWSMTWPFAAGAVVSSVSDLARWDAALYSEKVLKRSSLDQMWTAGKLNDGKAVEYGLGWQLNSFKGHKVIGHGGSIAGFTCYLVRFPDDKLTVVVLANLNPLNPRRLAEEVAALYLAE